MGIVLQGAWPPMGAERSGPSVGLLDAKGVVANVLAGLGVPAEEVAWRAAPDVDFLHPGKSVRLVAGDRTLGLVGALHPRVVQALDLTGEVFVSELDFQEVGHDYYPTEDAGEWWNAVDQEFGPMWSGEDTVENTLQRTTDAVNEIFSRRGSF